jgi:hypothetical protein
MQPDYHRGASAFQQAGNRLDHVVGSVARKTGVDHRRLNAELIKRTGGRVDQGTIRQLERRIALLERWRIPASTKPAADAGFQLGVFLVINSRLLD